MLAFLASLIVPAGLVIAQSADLQGTVGSLTSVADKKATKTCDITDYGATADGKTDISTALTDAYDACKTGGVIVIPEGDYALETWVTLTGGSAWALQLDGTIYRTGTDEGNMIFIEHTSDFELFSSTGAGTMQGYGYKLHSDGASGPRLLRFYEVENFSVHDIILVDAPMFHLVLDTCDSGEVYNMLIRGGDMVCWVDRATVIPADSEIFLAGRSGWYRRLVDEHLDPRHNGDEQRRMRRSLQYGLSRTSAYFLLILRSQSSLPHLTFW